MRPTAPLLKRTKTRIRFTTKQVTTGGFYRGTGTGALGAHTSTGGYLIDYRKTRTWRVPDNWVEGLITRSPFYGDKLTPYVTKQEIVTDKEVREVEEQKEREEVIRRNELGRARQARQMAERDEWRARMLEAQKNGETLEESDRKEPVVERFQEEIYVKDGYEDWIGEDQVSQRASKWLRTWKRYNDTDYRDAVNEEMESKMATEVVEEERSTV